MNDLSKLVIVGTSRVDANSEQSFPSKTENNIWVQTVPYDFDALADKTVKLLPDHIKNHVNTVIVCSAADDSYARMKTYHSERARPRDVLGALGISLTTIVNKHFPKVSNIFKVDAACASGLYAFDVAKNYKNIDNGIIVIAGVEKSTSFNFLNLFKKIGAVAQDSSESYAPFDSRRAGFVMGEGAAMLAITTKKYATQHQLEILATIDSVDTRTILTHPTSPSDPDLLKTFIENTIQDSGRFLDEISWWDAHATATPDGDQAEYDIFSKIFKDQKTVISSYKSRVGHCMSASSVVEIANAIEQLQAGRASPTYNLKRENTMVDDPRIILDSCPVESKTFIKTSFGFGGRNGVAVITVC
jgi:3-oxoacyl-(acyl-carrier-protein) synthase